MTLVVPDVSHRTCLLCCTADELLTVNIQSGWSSAAVVGITPALLPTFCLHVSDITAVCHPLPGVNDIIKEHAQLISEKGGFRCIIPDLYKGKVGVDKEEASHVSAGLLLAVG
eukprot:GHUV01055991.1.p1 GENE.GHUV01055991.1~~GHUV01055991.1.p1  ORF type:complete len:113 (-),score=19.67 GHUV01055991.1:420-758(-)